MSEQTVLVDGVRVPRFLYGTAWKEARTQGLTELALQQGFRGIDTANQRRHYHEAAVGQAIVASIESGLVAEMNCSCRLSSPFSAVRIIACRTIPRPPSQSRLSSRLPVRSNIWASR